MAKGIRSREELEKLRKKMLSSADPNRSRVIVSGGTCGESRGSQKVYQAFVEEMKSQRVAGKVDLKYTGCHGFCEREPVVLILPEETCYQGVKPEDVPEIVSETLLQNKVVERLTYEDPQTGDRVARESDIPFYRKQSRIVFGNNRFIDPTSVEDYIAIGGYSAMASALCDMTPEQVLAEVKKADIRGRGGAGFPAAVKWQTTRNSPGDIKYVIVNCDEGDPGAYMDRALMEGNPHSVLEGLIIGGYAIGAGKGYVYVRQEYPLATKNTLRAIEEAERYGFLGKNIMGSGFDFTVEVQQGAGAFVSGESSALMSAIEGRVGEPRPKYIRTSISGIWGKPSNLNNVETWANVPLVINKGADWFASIGTEGSKGTKIFSLVGKVNNTGLVEVPMGTTLREIIYDIGGGIPGGKKFKAVQTGGPSGGCIPEQFLDKPVDFDELSKVGAMMGSGGMIVMDEDNCMVDVARYFVDFLTDESCGKCVPCREGLRHYHKILGRIVSGEGREGDIMLLEDLSDVLKDASLCALGQTAANPVLTTIQYFRDEYEAHVKEKRCPALVCKDLISYYIEPEKCAACLICLRNCPVNAISGGKGLIHVIDQEKCTKCNTCLDLCPEKFSAVKKLSGEPVPPPPLRREISRKKGDEE